MVVDFCLGLIASTKDSQIHGFTDLSNKSLRIVLVDPLSVKSFRKFVSKAYLVNKEDPAAKSVNSGGSREMSHCRRKTILTLTIPFNIER